MECLISQLAREIKTWWNDSSCIPKPSPFFMLFLDEDNMSHTKTLIVAMPDLTDIEKNYKDESGATIVGRHVIVTVNGSVAQDVTLAFDQVSFTHGGIPAGSSVQVDMTNILTDGHEGLPKSRTATAPPAPQPIPIPGDFTMIFEDEPDA